MRGTHVGEITIGHTFATRPPSPAHHARPAWRLHPRACIGAPTSSPAANTYDSTLRILCEAFQLDTTGRGDRCEARLIQEAQRLNHSGKMLAPIIDDAHLMSMESLRRLRLLFEDFPKNHNLILVAQPQLLSKIALTLNEDIKSRVTYSVLVAKLAPDDMSKFIC
jgi:MSHA biogenesis protein MshM